MIKPKKSIADLSLISTSQGQIPVKSTIKSGTKKFSISNIINPLFDAITRICPANTDITFIVTFIQLLQSHLVAGSCFGAKLNLIYHPFFQTLYFIVDLGAKRMDGQYQYIVASIISAISVLIFIFLLCILVYYKSNKIIANSALLTTKIFLSYVSQVLIIPAFSILGLFIDKMNNKSAILISILLSITSIIFLVLCYSDLRLRISTIYVENTVLTQFYDTTYIIFLLSTVFISFLIFFLSSFPIWGIISMAICYCFVAIYCAFKFCAFPFMNFWMNSFMAAFCFTQIYTIFIQLVQSIDKNIILITPFIFFCLAFIIFYVTLNKMANSRKIRGDLSSSFRGIRALRATFVFRPKMLFKWETTARLAEMYPSSEIILKLAQILSYFPIEGTEVMAYLSKIKKHELDLFERFLIFQIKRSFYQQHSKSTKQLSSDLNKMQNANMVFALSESKLLQKFIDERWSLNFDDIIGISRLRQETHSLCREVAEKYPNSPNILIEYAKFLVENSDFLGAVAWVNRAKRLEKGQMKNADLAFVRIANVFPNYVRIIRRRAKKGNNLINNQSISESSQRTEENDDSLNATSLSIGDAVIKQLRMRIVIQSLLSSFESRPLYWLKWITIIVSIVVGLTFIVLFNVGYTTMSISVMSNSLAQQIFEAQQGLHVAYYAFLDKWMLKKGLSIHPLTNKSTFYNTTIDYIAQKSIKSLYLYLNLMYYSSRFSYLAQIKDMFSGEHTSYMTNNKMETAEQTVYGSSLMFTSMTSLVEAASEDFEWNNWMRNHHIANTVLNFCGTSRHFDQQNAIMMKIIRGSLLIEQSDRIILTYVIPIVFLVVATVPSYITLHFYFKETEKWLSTITTLPTSTLKTMVEPLSYKKAELNGISWVAHGHKAPRILMCIMPAFAAISTAVLTGVEFTIFSSKQQKIGNSIAWMHMMGLRNVASLKLTNAVALEILANVNPTIEWLHQPNAFYDISNETLRRELEYINNNLKADGFSEELDSIHYKHRCTNPEYPYECMSVSELIVIFTASVNNIYHEINQLTSGVYDYAHSPSWMALLDIETHHLFDLLNRTQTVAQNIYSSASNEFKIDLGIILGIGFVSIIMYASVMFYSIFWCQSAFQTLLGFIARLPPKMIITNKSIMNLICSNSDAKIIKMQESASIIETLPIPILEITEEKKIEYLNNAACQYLGYTKEQLLKVDISSISSDLVQEDCDSYLSSVTQGDGTRATYKVQKFFCQDCTILFLHPAGVVNQINESTLALKQKGEISKQTVFPKRVSESNGIFVSNYCCFVIVKVLEFDESVTSLRVSSVMKFMEHLFSTLNILRTKYSIDLVNVSGSSFIAASGLFDIEANHKAISVQAMKFSLDSQREVEISNAVCDTNLRVGITICSGGPVVCCHMQDSVEWLGIAGKTFSRACELANFVRPAAVIMPPETLQYVQDLPGISEVTFTDTLIDGNVERISIVTSSTSSMRNSRKFL